MSDIISFYNSLPDICSFCQREFTLQNPRTLDHIKPFCELKPKNRNRSLGFKMISNLLICCRECNQLKDKLSVNQFQAKLANPNPRYDHKFINVPFERRIVMVQSINVLINNTN